MDAPATRINLVWGAVFGISAVLLTWSRLAGLDQSFWHDEVFTVLNYAGRGPRGIFLGEYVPNNHVLFEMLAWGTTRMLGESEVIYRLWGVLPALGAAAWLSWWMCRRFGQLAAAWLLLLITVSPLLLLVSREARGYGLTMLAMTGLIVYGDGALARPSSRAVWGFVSFGLMGVLTMPVFVLPYTLGALALLLEPKLRARLLRGLIGSGLVALAWFSPMLTSILAHSAQRYGVEIPLDAFATAALTHLVFPILWLLLPGVPDITQPVPSEPAVVIVIWHAFTWVMLIAGAGSLLKQGRNRLLALLAVMAFGTYALLAALGFWVVDRFVSYLSLPVFVVLAVGGASAITTFTGIGRRVATLAFAGLAVWSVASFVPLATHLIQVPFTPFKEAAALANASGAELVVTNSRGPEGFEYYLETMPLVLTASQLERMFCAEEQEGFVFLDHPFMAEVVDKSCLLARGAVQIRPERRSHGGVIDVWLVGLPDVVSDN